VLFPSLMHALLFSLLTLKDVQSLLPEGGWGVWGVT